MVFKDKVKALLEARPEFRDSDRKLMLYVWERQGLELTDAQKQVFMDKCTPAESITRARRVVQEENEHLRASEEVQAERDNKAREYQMDAKVHTMQVPETYRDEDGREYVRLTNRTEK